MGVIEDWTEVYYRFDPFQPPRDPAWRVDRPKSRVPKLIDRLALPVPKRFLLLATQGTGKSTEMLRILEAQRGKRTAVYLDLVDHFAAAHGGEAALQLVQPWEVLTLVGLAVVRIGREIGMLKDGEEQDLERAIGAIRGIRAAGTTERQDGVLPLASALTLSVAGAHFASQLTTLGPEATAVVAALVPAVATGAADLAKRAASAAGAAGKEVAAAASGFVRRLTGKGSFTLPLGSQSSPKVEDQDQRARDLVNAVNHLIGLLQSRGAPLVMLVDGLDRIRNHATTRNLFVDSHLLATPECRMVVGAPVWLRREGLAGNVCLDEAVVLPEIPVLRQESPWQPDPLGIAFFREVYARRMTGLDVSIPEALVDRLALRSGGKLRDFMKLVRLVAEHAMGANARTADPPMVDDSIDNLRRTMELGLNAGHVETLRRIVDDAAHRLPADDGTDRVMDMLERFWVLPYPNESEWYFPHPLLHITVIKPPG